MDVEPGDVCVLRGGIVGIRLESGEFLFLSDHGGKEGPDVSCYDGDIVVERVLGNISDNFLALEKAIVEAFPEYNLTL